MTTKAEYLEILDQERQRRIEAMSPSERQRHDAWNRSHAAGPPEARVGKKLLAAYETSNADPQDFTIAELEAMIADLKAARDAPKPKESVFE